MIDESDCGLLTVWPPTDVITSPSASPAPSAGVPDATSHTAAPGVDDPPWPRPPRPPTSQSEIDAATLTPSRAVAPMCTADELLLASICLAMAIAVLMGMAYPS